MDFRKCPRPVTHTCNFVFRFVQYAQVKSSLFYPLHTYLIKNPLQTKNQGAIIRPRKEHFQSPFHFLISLFSWTPRYRLVNDTGALHFSAQKRTACKTFTGSSFYISSQFSNRHVPALRFPGLPPLSKQRQRQSAAKTTENLQPNTKENTIPTCGHFPCCTASHW